MRKIKIILSKYFVWFLVNFMLCLIPILISGIIINAFSDGIFLSYLAYTYTLIITGLYVFDSNDARNSVLLWLSIIFSTLTLCLFILFPQLLPKNIISYLREQVWIVSVVILLTSIIISFFLNKSSIDKQINEVLNQKKFQSAKESGKRFDAMKIQLNNEQ